MFLARGGRWWSLMQSGCLSEDVPAMGPPPCSVFEVLFQPLLVMGWGDGGSGEPDRSFP